MATKSAFQINLNGFTSAAREATVKLVNQSTGKTIERKPFLDGTLLVRDLDPGDYEVEVRHPNLTQPIDRRRIKLFPQPRPTVISIPIPEKLFVDNPIRDIPDANLAPVQQAVTTARDQLGPVMGKSPGEMIKATDWNTLVDSVSDMAGAVLELTNVVSPHGHDHPEIAEKIAEVQENLRRFAEAYGQSLLEIRRELEAQKLQNKTEDVFSGVDLDPDIKQNLRDHLDDLKSAVQETSPVFTGKLTQVARNIQETVQAAAQKNPAVLDKPEVKELLIVAEHYTTAGRQVKGESELISYRAATSKSGGKNFEFIKK
ncbi:MAG: hypothetical protein IPP94_05110 [Ignavibacteria bacterium]|nr:hypothetical protein [Ignavibacteria bacterium]